MIPDDARGRASHVEKDAPDVLKKNPSLDFQGASLAPGTSSQIPSKNIGEISHKSDVISVPIVDDNIE